MIHMYVKAKREKKRRERKTETKPPADERP
jgi:hypothetical protein